ncbi:30S ribosomal protein S7 [Candidatus Collierbacteria bacterium CG09_land_8_20_14_0_10_46_12]|uniref:Small ribosomal subunit protein uS7 n=2 Tax=Candidatus Collieribacteriota TaxID=1752725 RepID=A0A2H0X1F1_9BACT|nr:MAG: 30S ribosomal protein S7 [Candidatus Collierbacteria bacterium CG09_land_8_20_14_0_10_46_12]
MRAKSAKLKKVEGDVKYNSLEVAKLINRSMQDGKKVVAEKQIYKCMDIIGEKTGAKPLDVLLTALGNIKPKTEVRSRRIGGTAYQVPMPVSPRRQFSMSIRWLVEFANKRSNSEYHTYGEKLAAEIMDAYNNQGAAIKKRDDVHRMADANKAFSHFRW